MRRMHLHSLWCALLVLALTCLVTPRSTQAQDDGGVTYSRTDGDGALVFSSKPDDREIEVVVTGEVHLKGGVGMISVADMPESQDVWDEIIARWARERRLPFELVKAMIWTESRMAPNALSHAGALGLMQLMPATARGLGLSVSGSVDERSDPNRNIQGGSLYIRQQIDRFATGDNHLNNLEAAIGAYNAGPGAIREIKRGENHVRWTVPTNGETEGYVPTVLERYRLYLKQDPYPGMDDLRPKPGGPLYPW